MSDKAEIFRKLRARILSSTPEELKIAPLETGVWGTLMEFSSGETSVTLLAVAGGTTSLYFGSGGGIIGAGKSEVVRKANRLLLDVAGRQVGALHKVVAYPTAQPGRICFYVLKKDGVYGSGEFSEADLRKPNNALLQLYAAGQNVITNIRLVQDKQP